jgi:hypothetical protein
MRVRKDFVSLLIVALQEGSEKPDSLLPILCLSPEPQDISFVGIAIYFSVNSPAFVSQQEQLQMSFCVYVM